jgi:glycerophosphoryl diester phosphodiesterase
MHQNVEDVIVTELIEVAEEVLAMVVKRNVNLDSNIKEVDEEGQWTLAARRSGRVSKPRKRQTSNHLCRDC